MTLEAEETAPAPAKPFQWWRVALLVVLFVGSLVAVKLSGADQWLSVERVRDFMTQAGALGFVAFVALFTIGELMHVPGWVFIGAASFAYGQSLGLVASYVGALISLSISFYVIRMIGGQPLGAIRRPFLRKILARLDSHPILTVTILRFLLMLTPAVNYALAMSTVRYRDYLIGSALGLIVPVALWVFLFDWLAQFWH